MLCSSKLKNLAPSRVFLCTRLFIDILPKNEKFKNYFFTVMFTSELMKAQHLRSIWKAEAVFQLI